MSNISNGALTERTIFHCDMNAYFASVEELFEPGLKDVPMAICGDPESRRGIIVAKNEKAKAYGIKTAETIYQAKKKCPRLVLRPARHRVYSEYCKKANAIYEKYTDLLEMASIDESYLDVTGSLKLFQKSAEQLANEIRLRIQSELGLTISVGVSYNKFFAKMASDMKKPNAVTILTRENYKDLLWPLPIGEMHMVGKASEAALRKMNIRTIGDLAALDERTLIKVFGKYGEFLFTNAHGLDRSEVLAIDAISEAQSIGNGITFRRDLVTREDILTGLTALSDTVSSRLRHAGLKCRALQVTIKDPNLKVITRQKALNPTWLMADLIACAMELVEANWQIGKPIRLLTITAMRLSDKDDAPEQLSFLAPEVDEDEKKAHESLARAMDEIRKKYGDESITTANIIKNDLGI